MLGIFLTRHLYGYATGEGAGQCTPARLEFVWYNSRLYA